MEGFSPTGGLRGTGSGPTQGRDAEGLAERRRRDEEDRAAALRSLTAAVSGAAGGPRPAGRAGRLARRRRRRGSDLGRPRSRSAAAGCGSPCRVAGSRRPVAAPAASATRWVRTVRPAASAPAGLVLRGQCQPQAGRRRRRERAQGRGRRAGRRRAGAGVLLLWLRRPGRRRRAHGTCMRPGGRAVLVHGLTVLFVKRSDAYQCLQLVLATNDRRPARQALGSAAVAAPGPPADQVPNRSLGGPRSPNRYRPAPSWEARDRGHKPLITADRPSPSVVRRYRCDGVMCSVHAV